MKLFSNRKKRFLAEVIAFVGLLYGTTCSVFLNGDDFMYGTFAHDGILRNVWDYYFTGNGRLWINVLDSALLWFDRYLYIVIAPLVVLAFVWLLAKNLQMILGCSDDREKGRAFMEYGMVFFACLDVLCLRETVFWITGMMNYLLPAVMFLLGYYLFQLARAGKMPTWKRVVYCAVAFLTACSVEQYALMFVGIMTLHHGWDLVRKKRIPMIQWLSYGLSLLGLACLILAPGNFVRVDFQGTIKPTLVDNSWTLVYQNTFNQVAFPYLFMLALALYFLLHNQRGMKILSATTVVMMLVCLTIPLLNKAIILVALLASFIFQAIYFCVCRCEREKRFGIFALSFVGIGSQVMLLISAIWGFRCMLSLYMVYMLLIGILLQQLEREKRLVILCVGLLASIHPALALVFWVACGVCQKWKQRPVSGALCKTLLRVCTAAALIVLCLGYGSNVPTYQENLAAINEKKETVVIHQLPREEYSWYWVPFNEFHVDYFKQYYELDASTELVFELLEETE